MCLYPRLIKNKKYEPNKKNGGIIPAIRDKRTLVTPIGCGECIECRRKLASEWTVRMMEHIRHHTNGKYVTLTFSNENIKKYYLHEKLKGLTGYDLDNAAAKLAVRHYYERWRKKYKITLKHWLITELGHEGTENIHMHGIVWADDIEEIVSKWGQGYVYVGDYVDEKTINYCVKYITKKDIEHKYYKPCVISSNGMGKDYVNRYDAELNKYDGENTKETYTTRQGSQRALPIYLRNKIYSDEERENLWIKKLDENVRYVLGQKVDVSQNEEMYYILLNEARRKNIKYGYGNNEKDWRREKYEEQRRILKQQERIDNIKDKLPYGAKKELYESWNQHKGMKPNGDFDNIPTKEEIAARNEARKINKELQEWQDIMNGK